MTLRKASCIEDYRKVSDEGGGTYTFCETCPRALDKSEEG